MALGCLEIGLIVAAVLFAFYKYLTKNDDYFKKRGVKFEKPTFIFGNMFEVYTEKENGISIYHKFYNMFRSEKIWGMFIFTRPVFLIRDAEVVKHIMVKEFDHFLNHDANFSKYGDRYFARSLLHLESDHWREMRTALSPIFTSSKLKTMYHHLTSCAQQLTEYLDEEFVAKGNLVIESKEVFARFTSEAISSISLGLQGNCLKDEDSEIHKLAQNIQADLGSVTAILKMVLVPVFPTLAKLFGVKIFRQSIQDFFRNYVSGEMARREREGVTGNKDVIQLLIQAKKEQQSDEKSGKTMITDWNDEELMAAQVFIFFAGGFDSVSTAMQMMSWELAKNPEVQQTLIEEVDEVLATMEGNDVSYEALNKLKFLDMVIIEVLRKWPPFSLGQRECNKDCRVETDDGKFLEFRKGDMIIVPVHPMHYDSKYFENPYKFDPTRWSDEKKQNIVPGSFMTFGLGPRMCLGSRLALIEIKLAFFTVLSKYKIEVCSQTAEKVTHSSSPMVLKDKVFVELKPRKQ